MQGARENPRAETYLTSTLERAGRAQRRRWTFFSRLLDSGNQHLKGLAWAALEVENHCVRPEGFAREGTPA